MEILKSDPFVVISGDVVSNVNLRPVIEAHKARRKNKAPLSGGKNNVMTMVFSCVDPVENRLRRLDEELLVVMDSTSKQILKFETNKLELPKVSFKDGDLFEEHGAVEMRYDLVDCCIDICSPEMVTQIADNYDYRDLRQDYVRNEVLNRDLDYRITAHVVNSPGDYACRVRCWRTYSTVARDVVRRWVYPQVPDANWISEDSQYSFERGFRYKAADVKLSRTCQFGEGSMLGKGSLIEEGASVVNSIIGPGCVIHEGATIRDSNLWANIVVGAGARVESALICNNVSVGAGSTVSRGCVLAPGVKIGDGFTTAPFLRITTLSLQAEQAIQNAEGDDTFFSDSDEGADESPAQGSNVSSADADVPATDVSTVGLAGVGRSWTVSASDALDAQQAHGPGSYKWAEDAMRTLRETSPGLTAELLCGSIACHELEAARRACWSTAGDLAHDLEDDDEEEDLLLAQGSGAPMEQIAKDRKLLEFVGELLSAYADPASGRPAHDSVVLELNGQKFAQNRSFEEILYAVVPTMLGPAAASDEGAKQVKSAVLAALDRWEPSISKIIQDVPEEVALIHAVELIALYGAAQAGLAGLALASRAFEEDDFDSSKKNESVASVFPFILSHLYEEDFISLDAVIEWSGNHADLRLPLAIVNAKYTKMIVTQIMEASDDEEDEDSHEGDDDVDDEEEESDD